MTSMPTVSAGTATNRPEIALHRVTSSQADNHADLRDQELVGDLGQDDVSDENRIRLGCLVTVFGLALSDIAKAADVSRPLVSRILSGDRRGNTGLYRKLEMALPQLIASRQKPYFRLEPAPISDVISSVDALCKG